jgi:hypothetical protein
VQERLMETRALFNGAHQHRLRTERLNATFRARLASLARRSRARVHDRERSRWACGWWVLATASCAYIEACAKSVALVVETRRVLPGPSKISKRKRAEMPKALGVNRTPLVAC